MNFRQLIWRNISRNTQTYGSYFLSSVYSVFVFFIFGLLYFHPQLQNNLPANSDTISALAKMGLGVSQVVIIVLSIIFLWYSFANFLSARKRDLAIYLMLGMSPKNLRKMVVGENLTLGSMAIFSGVLLGTIFAKIFLLVAQKMLHLTDTLKFYFPWQAIILSVVSFFLIFILISFLETRKIETENLTDLAKGEEKAPATPKAKLSLAILDVVSLIAGYGLLIYFVRGSANFYLLLACVLLTILATFLLLHQFSIIFLQYLKKKPRNKLGQRLLLISELIFQTKKNASMYALIALTASVAFVGLGVTMAIGSANLAQNTTISFSYILSPSKETQEISQKITEKIQEKYPEAQQVALEFTVNTLEVNYQTPFTPNNFWPTTPTFIKASQYNQLATSAGLPPLHPTGSKMYTFASYNSELKTLKSQSAKERTAQGTMTFQGEEIPVVIEKIPDFLNVNLWDAVVVEDALFEKIYHSPEEQAVGTPTKVWIINYSQWAKDAKFSQSIDNQLTEFQESYNQKYLDDSFFFTSRYQQWQAGRQANGLIMLIGILLGGVFFIFAASILSFRLFGQIPQARKYQHALDLLGIPEKMRKKIIRREMLLMYFLPGIIATLHFTMAFWALQLLSAISFWNIYFQILLVYFIFQFLFFLFSSRYYFRQLNLK
ncbi:ABC transporter permease [Enterococcus timonensis]|uniref:ABC transporter permease n=1 Tax=Enterococcus timonensis TaxID=1852364 RepID=UPI0008DAFB1B|nr:ABC transporter permease [Enterococcus timonensis]